MRRRALRIAAGLAALLCLLVSGVVTVLQTSWFADYLRREIISSAESATGGRVEVGRLDLNIRQLRAVITGFVIHGTEPGSAEPFLRVAKVEADFRLFASFRRLFEITFIGIGQPQVNVIELADGRTNIPAPKNKSAGGGNVLQTIVDLEVRRFELTNGFITVSARKQALDVRGNNLHALLSYEAAKLSYHGMLSVEPVYMLQGRNTPVNFTVTVPVTLERDRVEVRNGSISTADSTMHLNGSLENMRDPKFSVRTDGFLSVTDLRKLTNLPVTANLRGLPPAVSFQMNATASNDRIEVETLRAVWGESSVGASGMLKNPQGGKGLSFQGKLGLDQLSRLLQVSAQAGGTVAIHGTASLDAGNDYAISGNVDARDLFFQTKDQRIAGVRVASAFRIDPAEVSLADLRVSGAGGDFEGSARLEHFAKYELNGNLRGIGLQDSSRALGSKLPYDGRISGLVRVTGDLNTPGVAGLSGDVNLSIASGASRSGASGIPVSGQLNAHFNGATGDIVVANARISLPHTNLTISGSGGHVLNVSLTSTNISDLLAAALVAGPSPINLDGGQLTFQGTVAGGLTAPRIAGQLEMTRFQVEGRSFDDLKAELSAASSGASILQATLARGSMTMNASASVGLKNWAAPASAPVSAEMAINHADFADLVALAGQRATGYSGLLNASANVSGTLGNPQGTANLEIDNGTIEGETFHQLRAQAELTNQRVRVPVAYIESSAGRLSLTAGYSHPGDRFTPGQLDAHLRSTPILLNNIRNIDRHIDQGAAVSGSAQIDADVSGTIIENPDLDFVATSVNANVSGHGLKWRGLDYGDLSATVRTNAQTATYNLTENWQGSAIRVTGNTRLAAGYQTVADATFRNVPIDRFLVPAAAVNMPVRGDVNGTVHFDGTPRNPQGNVDLDLSRAVLYDEPVENVRLQGNWLPGSVELSRLEVTAAPGTITATGRYDHPAGNLLQGTGQFNISSSEVALSRVRELQKRIPGLGGAVTIRANGAAQIRGTTPRVVLTSLDSDVTAKNIEVSGSHPGNLTFRAETKNGGQLTFDLNSDLAGSSIRGHGTADLAGDYPVNARLDFANLSYQRLRPLMGVTAGSAGPPPGFDAVTDGEMTMSGPALRTDQLRASLQLTKLNISATPPTGRGKPVTISNQGPLVAALENGRVLIRSAHLSGPETDVTAGGSASLTGQQLDLKVTANTGLDIVPGFYPEVESSGKAAVTATIEGGASSPLIDGQLTLSNAAFHYAGISNGISNANGVIVFNRSNATIRRLTAESGGGKVVLTGFVGYSSGLRFGVEANASGVRIRPQEGVSLTIAAGIRLSGTSGNSVIAGNVTVDRFTYNAKSDIGSMLSRAAPGVSSATAPSDLLENMRLEIRVRSATGVAVQASLAQNLQADMDLQVRGTAAQPAVLGRITINEGKLVFFGVSYTVDNGTISFYNPVRIAPVLDISLETAAQGVHVTVRVTGPIDDMKLSYTSDPPLQFQEIIALLATGQTPTSDPTLLASQPLTPQPSFQQMGESALLTQALAKPLADRLQRVFGVTQLKLSPTFQSGTQLPTARVTVQQQVNSNITFTYTSALDDPNGLIVNIEWAFSPQYSAVATRDQNGIFSLNFYYKRRFH